MTSNDDSTNIGNINPHDRPDKLPAIAYVRAARGYLKRNNPQEAYRILQAAKVLHPDDPFVLSYYGSLQAVVNKQYRAGVENCKKALALLAQKPLMAEYLIFSEFYLNLGRAYLAADMRSEAIRAFQKGLRHEKHNKALLQELRACERRARPFLSFFDRSNPINKYFGMVLRRAIDKAQ